MKEIYTEIKIRTDVQNIWQILTDFSNYHEWNPFIRDIEGTPKVGSKLTIHLRTSKGKNRTYNPRVTKMDPHKEIRWYGKSLIPGIFNGERIYTLEQIGTDQTKFIHREIFTGILVELLGNRLDKDMFNSFTEMNEALKKRVE